MRNCKNVREIDPISKLCPPCNTWFKEQTKRLSSHERQQTAREEVQNQNRNLNSPGSSQPNPVTGAYAAPPPASSPPTLTADIPVTSTANSPSTAGAPSPPTIDIKSIQDTYNQLKHSSTESPATLNMYALMLNIHSKLPETEALRYEIKKVNNRLDALEAKIGDGSEISERLGLALRFLPLPPTGYTDLDIVKQILAEVRAPGINVDRDVVKAVRKLPSQTRNLSQPILGTVLVEMKNEESRASIMKNKHALQYHPDNTIRSVIIKNMKSREQMLIENIGNNILKRIPGSENSFLGGNGQIRDSLGQNYNQPRPRNLASQTPHFRPQNPPPAFRPQPQPPRFGPQLSSTSPAFRPYNVLPPNHTARPQYIPQNHDPRQLNPLPQSFPMPPQPYAYGPETTQGYSTQNAYASVPPPQVAVAPPTSQARPPAPLQDLLSSLDSLYEQHPGPASNTRPDLHLMQPADPHHGQDQLQQVQASHDQHQVGDISDNE